MYGGGEWWRFLIEKPGEIPEQLKLFVRSLEKGHSINTLPSIGNWIHKYGTPLPEPMLLNLSKIMLWHPVRGKSERANAGAKTDKRRNAMIAYFNNLDKTTDIHLTEELFRTTPGLESMISADAITVVKITPLLQLVKRDILNKTQKQNIKYTRSVVDEIRSNFTTRKQHRIRALETEYVKPKTKIAITKPIYYDIDEQQAIPYLKNYNGFYIVSSGQGRVQAIKEAAEAAGIDFSKIHLESKVYNVKRNLCNLFLIIGNEYRKDGFFSDPRHLSDNKFLPAAESCAIDGPTTEDTLSMLREFAVHEPHFFNVHKFNENKFNNNARGGRRTNTRKNSRK